MAKPDRTERKQEGVPAIDLEGEPHPADLLASLNRADNPSGARSGTAQAGESQAGESRASEPRPAAPLPITESAEAMSVPAPELMAEMPRPETQRPETQRMEPVPAAARALAAPQGVPMMPESEADLTALHRTLKAFSSALPTLQRLAPLLEGNALTALLGLLAPHPQPGHTTHSPANLGPIENSVADLKAQHKELRGVVLDHDLSVRRMTDQVQLVREATERNTLEQQEMIEELKSAGKKMNVVALLAFALLAGSIAVNVYLYFEIHRLLP